MDTLQLFLGQLLNPMDDLHCQWWEKGALLIKKNKKGVYSIFKIGHRDDILKKYGSKCLKIHDYSYDFLMPGFFDMHFHWVQDAVSAMPKKSLLTWLRDYTWPHEAKFKDKSFSTQRAKSFAEKLLKVGTLGGACFASLHGHTVDHALKHFVGDFVLGNVLMTMNSPDYLKQSQKNALQLVGAKALKFKQNYAFTPRFALTTHPEVMREGWKMAREQGAFMQSHLCETEGEIKATLDIFHKLKGFEKVKTYGEIYHRLGLFSSKSLMGHGIYLTPKEWQLLAATKTTIAHCPTSNAPVREKGLGSGLFDFKKADKMGVNWVLGTDIGGGPHLSMFDVLRSFVRQNANAGKRGSNPKGATYVRALYRGTLRGADFFGHGRRLGNLDLKKEANFIVAQGAKKRGWGGYKSAEEALTSLLEQKSLTRLGLNDLVRKTYYRGELRYQNKQ